MINIIQTRLAATALALANQAKPASLLIKQPKRSAQADTIANLISSDHLLVSSFLAAEGIHKVFLHEDRQGTGSFAVCLVGKELLQADIIKHAFEGIAFSDAILFFNPERFSGLDQDSQRLGIEHELWHLYLSKAFPQHAAGANSLLNWGRSWEVVTGLPLTGYIQELEHLFLRAVIIEAGSMDFAAKDAKLNLNDLINSVSFNAAMHTKSEDYLAVFFAACRLGSIIPFWLFTDQQAEARFVYQDLQALFRDWDTTYKIKYSRFTPEDILHKTMKICTGNEFNSTTPPTDLNMADISLSIMEYWHKLINNT